MRIHIIRHQIRFETSLLIKDVHGREDESFGRNPASLKRGIPKKNIAAAYKGKPYFLALHQAPIEKGSGDR